jgi:hypothetical protein
VALIDPAPNRTLDPLQSVLAHLPNNGYGMYEGVCTFLWNDPVVPPEIKEGLRFLSATRIGCAYCRTVREHDYGGRRLLPDTFYAAVASGNEDWGSLVDARWAPLFEVAAQILKDREVTAATMARAREHLSEAQIVQAIFFMLVVGASHRFSRAFGVEESCAVPSMQVKSP